MHFTVPFLTALAALGATVEGATCSRRQYADVAHQITNPAFFCKFWLENKRTSSPLRKYGVRSLTNLCRCFVANSPRVRGPYKPLRPTPPPKTCPISLYRPLKNQYSDPAYFCQWYLSAPRELSPIPAVNNPATVEHSCRCYLQKKFPPQISSTATNTPPAATTPRTTTSSTDDSEPTTTTTSDIVGPIGATTTTSSSSAERTTSETTRTSTIGLPTILPTTTTSSATTSSSTAGAGETTSEAATTSFTQSVSDTTSSASSSST